MDRGINFLLLTNYLIDGSEVEIIKSTGNSRNHHIYNDDDSQSLSTTTISIPSTKQEELLPSSFTKRILIIDDDTDIAFTFKKGLEAESSNKIMRPSLKYIRIRRYDDDE